jgi:predicted MFS family arabinose efflux permease
MTGNRWFALALLFLARTSMGFQFQTVGSVAPILADELALGYATIGTLIGLYLLPGVFISMPAGILGGRLGAKRLVVVGLLLMTAGGVLMGLSGAFVAIAAGRLLSGTGAVILNVLLTKMVADWFSSREMSTAMAILVTSWPLGIALGLIGFVPLATSFGWPAVMHVGAFACVICLVGVVVAYRDPPAAATAAGDTLTLSLNAREWLLVSLAGAVWATYNVGYIVLVSFLPALFADRGYSLIEATALASWLGWALMAFVPAGGYLADKLGWPFGLMTGAFIVVAAAGVLLVQAPAAMLAAFAVVALTIGLPAGPIMALPAVALRPHNRAAGMGIYFTWYYVLMAALPALAGLARDLTQDAGAPVLFAAAMMLVAAAATAGFHVVARLPAQAVRRR